QGIEPHLRICDSNHRIEVDRSFWSFRCLVRLCRLQNVVCKFLAGSHHQVVPGNRIRSALLQQRLSDESHRAVVLPLQTWLSSSDNKPCAKLVNDRRLEGLAV